MKLQTENRLRILQQRIMSCDSAQRPEQDSEAQRRADHDRAAINVARSVQESLFPSEDPSVPGFDIAGAVQPAERVSGDYYDYFDLKYTSVGVTIADVCGHGMGPAMLMAQTQAFLRVLIETESDPGKILTHANRLFATSGAGLFATAILGRVDPYERKFVYASAGHQGYRVTRYGDVHLLNATSLPLGVKDELVIPSARPITLDAGDIIVLPTDGIEESACGEDLFGRQRLVNVVRDNAGKSSQEIVAALFQAARDFSNGEPQMDDMSVVVVKLDPER